MYAGEEALAESLRAAYLLYYLKLDVWRQRLALLLDPRFRGLMAAAMPDDKEEFLEVIGKVRLPSTC